MAVAPVAIFVPPTTARGLIASFRSTMNNVASAVGFVARESARMAIEEPRGAMVVAGLYLGTLAATLAVTRVAQAFFS